MAGCTTSRKTTWGMTWPSHLAKSIWALDLRSSAYVELASVSNVA